MSYWRDLAERMRGFGRRNFLGSSTLGLVIVGFAAQCYIWVTLSMELLLFLPVDLRFMVGIAIGVFLFVLELLLWIDYDNFKERQKNE